MPELDFQLCLPEGVHAVFPMQYLDSWMDSFVEDNILSLYMLPDHFFLQMDEVRGWHANVLPMKPCAHACHRSGALVKPAQKHWCYTHDPIDVLAVASPDRRPSFNQAINLA